MVRLYRGTYSKSHPYDSEREMRETTGDEPFDRERWTDLIALAELAAKAIVSASRDEIQDGPASG